MSLLLESNILNCNPGLHSEARSDHRESRFVQDRFDKFINELSKI